jgi:D-beta-D-heptose 7-phosphate kinase/D-beta-D-heptose 1-phosphate adenosyltransferase
MNRLSFSMSFAKIIKEFKNKKLLVVGDIILDRYLYGKVSRISPEAPVPVVEVVDEAFLLGGAANVAHNIVSLGGKASVAGIIGHDRAGGVMQNLIAEKGIAMDGIIEDKRPTTVKTRVIAQKQQIVRFDREDRKRIEGKCLDQVLSYIKNALPEHDAVIISDYKKGVISSALIKALVKYGKPYRMFTAVDPKVGHFHFYKHVSLLTPNLTEASQGAGVEIKDDKSLRKAGRTLMNRLLCDAVLITRGEHGMSLFERVPGTRDLKEAHIPTVAQKVFDVTGAGDTVIATIALARAAGATLEQAAVVANHAAGIVIGEVGTAVTTAQAVFASISSASIRNP